MVSRLDTLLQRSVRISIGAASWGRLATIQWTMVLLGMGLGTCLVRGLGVRAWDVVVVLICAWWSVRSSAAAWLGRRRRNVSEGTGELGCL